MSLAARALAPLLALCAAASGCGDDGDPPPPGDGGAPDGSTGPSGIPWLATGAPELMPSPERTCPDGYRPERTDTGVLTCRAYSESGPESCPAGFAHFPGGAACERIGTPCPADGWPTDLPTDRTIVYVRAGAIGGRGSTSSPHGTITRAIERSPNGALIAVAPGVYNEQILLDDDLSIRGACPEETILTLDIVAETSVVIGTNIPGTYAIENLTIRGDGSMGAFIQGGADFRIEDVVIENAAGFGVYATEAGTNVDVGRLLVQGVSRFPGGTGGIGLQYIEGATGTIRHVASVGQDDGHLYVAEGASVTVERFAGIGTAGGGPADRSGLSMRIQDDATADLREVALWNNEGGGVFVGNRTTVTARDVEVENSAEAGLLSLALNLEVRSESVVTMEGVHLHGGRTAAILVGEDGELTMRDAVVRETRPSMEEDASGIGVTLEGQGIMRFERVLLEDLVRTGIVAMPETSLSLTDVVIRRIDGVGGRFLGLAVSAFGASTLERVVVEEATLVGLASSGDSAVMSLTDVVVRDTRSISSEGLYGRGLEANLGARIDGQRVALVGNREVSLTAFDPDTHVALDGFAILATQAASCGEACGGNAAGYGASVQTGATMELSRFLVADGAVLGLQVGPAGTLTARDGEISGSPIGLNIQAPDFDLATALTNVEFRDLERNVDATMLPLPPPGL